MHSSLRILTAVLLCAGGGFSAALADIKIAVVDYNRLLGEAPQARAAAATLEGEFAPRQKQLELQRKDLEARAQKFERDQPTMAEAERGKTQRDMRDMQVDFERRAKAFQEDGQMRTQEERQRLERVIQQEVRTFAHAQGFDLVLAGGVVYNTDALDVTAQVLKSLESKAASSDAAPAAPATAPAKAPKPAKP